MHELTERKQRILNALSQMKSEREGASILLNEALTELETIAGLLGTVWALLPETLRQRLEKYRR